LEWTRVAEDLTDCLVVFRISISIVSQTLLISMPRYGCNLVIRNPCLRSLQTVVFLTQWLVNFLFVKSRLPSLAIFFM